MNHIHPFGINISGYIQGEFGVAEAARSSIQSLSDSRIPLVLNNIQTGHHRYQDNKYDSFSTVNPYAFNLLHVNADNLPVFAKEKGQNYFKNKYNIGYWFWELSNFPEKWISSFSYLDEIWVASKFCQDSIAKSSPIPVVKMTFPILEDHLDIFPQMNDFNLPEDKFIFLFMYDYLSVIERKNPLGILNAFRILFEKNKDIALVIKTINSVHAPEKAEMLKNAGKDLPVSFIDQHISRKNISSLIASSDAFISLHRSEGFGISLAQSMYLKKPVIATAYSGNMEFMNHNNSFPVRYKLVELENDFGPYKKGNVWAEPDIEHAAELMELVYQGTDLVNDHVFKGYMDIRDNFSIKKAGIEMEQRLRFLYK